LLLQEWQYKKVEEKKKRLEDSGEDARGNEEIHHECSLDCPGYYARVWDKDLKRWGNPRVQQYLGKSCAAIN